MKKFLIAILSLLTVALTLPLQAGNRLDPDSYHAPTTSRFGFANSAGIGGSAGAGRPIRAA